jgi:fatty acid desaturase
VSNPSADTTFDASSVDLDALMADLRDVRREIDASLGEADLRHLRKIERLGRAATAIGVATAWLGPNPVSMAGLAVGRGTRWILMHHIGHRGYDKVPGVPARYTSKVFARGARRFVDWADWMIPEAWIYEHNVLHHSYTGEERDPDLVERNTKKIREADWPVPLKYAAMAGLAVSWRFYYYAPATLRSWRGRHEARRIDDSEIGAHYDAPGHEKELWQSCYLPFVGLHFVLFPALFLPLGPLAALSALANSIGGEVLCNLHTFAVIVPNHTGADVYRWSDRPATKAEGTLRQILGSVNYATGTEPVDFAQLFLNYQIEHHVWPDLPMLRYREAAPKLKAICAKHGIPYVQESLMTRVRKMLQVTVGTASMRRGARLTATARELAAE